MHAYIKMLWFLGLSFSFVSYTAAQSLELYEYRYDTTGQLQQIILVKTFDHPVEDDEALQLSGFIPYYDKHLLPDREWACIDTLDSLIFYRDCCNPVPRGMKKRVTSPTTCHDYHYYYTNMSGNVSRYLSASAEVETELLFHYTPDNLVREIMVKGIEHYYFLYENGKIMKVKKEAPHGTVELRFNRL